MNVLRTPRELKIWMPLSLRCRTSLPLPNLLHPCHYLLLTSGIQTTHRGTRLHYHPSNDHLPTMVSSSWLSKTHKTRMKNLTQSAQYVTSRDKCKNKTLFSYHEKELLWQHLLLYVTDLPMNLKCIVEWHHLKWAGQFSQCCYCTIRVINFTWHQADSAHQESWFSHFVFNEHPAQYDENK